MIAIVQVAIGLIFIFSLLSILVSTLNSIVAALLRTRTQYLKMGINTLLTDPELQAQFISHPLVKLVRAPMMQPGALHTPAQAQQAAEQMNRAGLTQLTWIEPRMFADVLISLLREKSEASVYGTLLLLADALPAGADRDRLLSAIFGVQATGQGVEDIRAAIAALPADQQANFLTALAPIEGYLSMGGGETGRLLALLDGVRRVHDHAFSRAMKVIVGGARTLDEARIQLENWFNARMDQLSELYRRALTLYSIVIGTLLVLLLNVDALHIGLTLWSEPTRRDAIVLLAEQAVQSSALTAPDAADDSPPPLDTALRQFDTTLESLLALSVPLGWAYLPVEGGCIAGADGMLPVACTSPLNLWAHLPGNSPQWGGLIVRKLIGLIVTIIAVAQGAPFWFDLLRRLVRR
jgi:hypothetical protein